MIVTLNVKDLSSPIKRQISRVNLKIRAATNNRVLLYSTGNYIQWPVINQNGKEYEKGYIYMYV